MENNNQISETGPGNQVSLFAGLIGETLKQMKEEKHFAWKITSIWEGDFVFYTLNTSENFNTRGKYSSDEESSDEESYGTDKIEPCIMIEYVVKYFITEDYWHEQSIPVKITKNHLIFIMEFENLVNEPVKLGNNKPVYRNISADYWPSQGENDIKEKVKCKYSGKTFDPVRRIRDEVSEYRKKDKLDDKTIIELLREKYVKKKEGGKK